MVRFFSHILILVSFVGQDSDKSKKEEYPAVEKAKKELKSPVHTERVRGATSLGEMGRAADSATRELCEAMVDRHASVRQAASEAMERVNPEIREIVFPIIADKEATVRVRHIVKAEALADSGKQTLPVIVWRLAQIAPKVSFQNASEAKACLAAVFAIGRDEKDAAEIILQMSTKASVPSIRGQCLEYLPELEIKDTKRIVTILTNAVRIEADSYKVVAMRGLAKIGKEAKPAIDTLRKAKGSTTAAVRTVAEESLATIEAAQ